jgi:hypothetical protein
VDSGYDTSELSPSSSTLSSPGEGLGYVEEIDQFLDSFEFGPHRELINISTTGEVDLIGQKSVVNDQAALENILIEERQGAEMEESIENIEDCVARMTAGQSQDPSSHSQEVTMYDINGKSFTVLQLNPVF